MNYPQWLRCATRIAGLALATPALLITPIADAQSVLSEPDFSGMNTPTNVFQTVARDGVRGWAQSVPWRQQPGARFGGFSGDGVRKIIDTGDAGIVVSWQQTTGIFGFGEIKLSRFSRAPEGVILPNTGGLNTMTSPHLRPQPAAVPAPPTHQCRCIACSTTWPPVTTVIIGT